VVGVPHGLTGEYPLAFVRLREGDNPPKEKELMAFCKERLEHYKVPRKVLFVSELPLSSVGKVLRRKLRDRYARGVYR
jgi:long-chain acyl-CoA synthetase